MAFAIPVRVYHQDTDAAGVVFHATYLDFMERARVEWLRNQGFEPQELARRFRLVFIVRHLDIAYLKPALLDDLVTVTAAVEKTGPRAGDPGAGSHARQGGAGARLGEPGLRGGRQLEADAGPG